jgi:hypothetical protein
VPCCGCSEQKADEFPFSETQFSVIHYAVADCLTRLMRPVSTSFLIAGKQRSKAIALSPIASSPLGMLIALRISLRNVVDIVDFRKNATVTRMFLITYITHC